MNREVATWRDEDDGMGNGKGERYWYDVTDQLTNVRYNADQVSSGNPVNWNRAMDYNYTPDRLNRASTVENGSVSSYQANALNQYGSVNGQGIGYDGNFNITSYNGVSFSYDAQNRLTGGSMQATYDGLGRCVRRATSSGTRLYTYNEWKPILEWDQWGNWLASNVYGAGADEILMRWDGSADFTIYKSDQHGNVVALLDSGGNIIVRYSYDAFGKPKVTGFWDENDRGGSAYGNRFMFTGREYFPELGIYDYRNRVYQPELGRFLQTDPTGFDAGDMNLFRYCGDDPVDRSDPTGLYTESSLTTFQGGDWRWFNGGFALDQLQQQQHQRAAGFTLAQIEQVSKAAPGTVHREKEDIVERDVDVVLDRSGKPAKGPDGRPARGSTDAAISAAQKNTNEYTLHLRIDSQIAKIGTAKERDAARAIERENQQKFSNWYHSPAVGSRAFFYAIQGGVSRLQTGMRNDLQNQITRMKLGDVGGYNNIYRRMVPPDED